MINDNVNNNDKKRKQLFLGHNDNFTDKVIILCKLCKELCLRSLS